MGMTFVWVKIKNSISMSCQFAIAFLMFLNCKYTDACSIDPSINSIRRNQRIHHKTRMELIREGKKIYELNTQGSSYVPWISFTQRKANWNIVHRARIKHENERWCYGCTKYNVSLWGSLNSEDSGTALRSFRTRQFFIIEHKTWTLKFCSYFYYTRNSIVLMSFNKIGRIFFSEKSGLNEYLKNKMSSLNNKKNFFIVEQNISYEHILFLS